MVNFTMDQMEELSDFYFCSVKYKSELFMTAINNYLRQGIITISEEEFNSYIVLCVDILRNFNLEVVEASIKKIESTQRTLTIPEIVKIIIQSDSLCTITIDGKLHTKLKNYFSELAKKRNKSYSDEFMDVICKIESSLMYKVTKFTDDVVLKHSITTGSMN